MIPYEKFAEIYDYLEADRHSERMAEYTLKIMRKFQLEPSDGLDLCCGTGSAIRILVQHGIAMSGLDCSKRMLAVARKKLRGHKVSLHCQTLPHFKIPTLGGERRARLARYDLVTSFYDSLNYLLTERDLKAAFRSVYRHLRPGGWFVFDMNTPNALRTIWGAQTWAGIKKDVAWIFRNDYSPDRTVADCHATFFLRSGRIWRRFDELHTEKGYPNRVIRSLLGETGFQVKGYYRCFSFAKPKPSTDRICAVARRPVRKGQR